MTYSHADPTNVGSCASVSPGPLDGCLPCAELADGAPARQGWGRTEPVTGYDYTYRTANYARAIR